MVVLTRKQLEKLSKEELMEELLTVNSIHEDVANLQDLINSLKNIHEWNLNLKFQKTAQNFFPNK